MPLQPDNIGESITFSGYLYVRSFICLSRPILLPQYIMNGLSNYNETWREYSLPPTDDPIRFWRSIRGRGQGHCRPSRWWSQSTL